MQFAKEQTEIDISNAVWMVKPRSATMETESNVNKTVLLANWR